MKGIITMVLLVSALYSTSQKLPAIDKSPMDMSYYPAGYPVLKIQNKISEPLAMRLIYSRPQLNGRRVFGDLQKLGEVWRLGANEATEIEFFKEVTINNKKIKKGRYTLYCIPYADKWTLMLNKDTDVWGAFKYDASKDIVRMDVPAAKNDSTEVMTMLFEKSSTGASLLIYWDEVKAILPIMFK